MANDGRPRLIGAVRNLALAVQRVAGQGIASGAVRGIAGELEHAIPEELEASLVELLEDLVNMLTRVSHELSEASSETLSERLATGAARGALSEARRQWPGVHAASAQLIERVNLWLEYTQQYAEGQLKDGKLPGQRAQSMAAGAVEGVVGKLEASTPTLARSGATIASEIGQALVAGLEEMLSRHTGDLQAFAERAADGIALTLMKRLESELAAQQDEVERWLSTTFANAAERTAAATVRGAGEELRRQAEPLRHDLGGESVFHRAGRELTDGVLSSLRRGVGRPLTKALGAAGALFGTGLLLGRALRH